MLNEEGGTLCRCGAWSDYTRVDGGWVATDLGAGASVGSDKGSWVRVREWAAGHPTWNAGICLYCQTGPTEECDECSRETALGGG